MPLSLWPHQQPAVDEILRHFNEGARLVVLSAPVGSGKTYVATEVHKRLGGSALYTCTTKQLQSQYLRDFPEARTIQGRVNYPTELYPEAFHYDGWRRVTADDCGGQSCGLCSSREYCPYVQAKKEAARTKLLCTNLAYFLNEANYASTSVTRGRDLCILDEGDLAESVLQGLIEVSISKSRRKRWDIPIPEKVTVPSSWTEWLADTIPDLKKQLQSMPEPSDLREQRTLNGLKRLIESLELVEDDLDPEEPGWVMDDYQQGKVTFKPVYVHHLAPRLLWPHAKKWLVMSATIEPVEEWVESLGFDGPWAKVDVGSTFDPSHRPVYYTPVAKVTKKTQETAYPRLTRAIEAISRLHPSERILVHCVSYKLTQYLLDTLSLPRPVFAYLTPGEKESTIREFEETEGAVLLAPSMERGYDGSGDKLSVVIVSKLPQPYLDKQTTQRLYSYGGQEWYVGQTVRSLVQMTGRHIRGVDERGTAYILDGEFERIYNKGRKTGGGHRLFPSWWTESLHMYGERRKFVQQQVKKGG